MGKIQLFDCTLQEGGYSVNWCFGKEPIKNIVANLSKSKVDIINLGFLSDDVANGHRSIYPSVRHASKAAGKKRGARFALTIDMSNPLQLRRIDHRKNNIVDFLCVVIYKLDIQRQLEYCDQLLQKGYQLCIQIANLYEYSLEEIRDTLYCVSMLQPDMVCIENSYGYLATDKLIEYYQLADELLPLNIDIAYSGNNLFEDVEAHVQFILSQDTMRTIFLMTTIAGIGRASGGLSLEIALRQKELSKHYVIEPIITLFDMYFRFYPEVNAGGSKYIYHLAIGMRCSLDYANYYQTEYKLSLKEMIDVFAIISLEDRGNFTKKKAASYVIENRKRNWNNKIGIVIPTANRAEAIDYYLKTIIKEFDLRAINFIIYDSSETNATQKVVEGYIRRGINCLKYVRYEGGYDGFSIDEKIISAYLKFSQYYEYIWIMRDGLIINIGACEFALLKLIERKYDIIVVDDFSRSMSNEEIKYDTCVDLFKEQLHSMTVLGLTIVKSSVILEIIREQPLDSCLNWGMWQPIAFFTYFADHGVSAASYVGHLFLHNIKTRKNAFWTKHLMWQWAERWYIMINRLPCIYNKHKTWAWKIGMSDFHPFHPEFLIAARAYRGLTIKSLWECRHYIPKVCDTSKWKFYGALCLPSKLCQYVLENQDTGIAKIINKLYKLLKRTYHFVRGNI